MKKLLLKLSIILSVLLAPAMLAPAGAVAFGPLDSACKNVSGSSICAQEKAQENNQTSNPVANVIAKAARIIALVIGIAAVIMIIVAGFTLIVSGNNSEAVGKAKNRIQNSIIGLVIAVLAYSIIIFAANHIG